jgi:hypothetical protein
VRRLSLHRKTPDRAREQRERAWALVERKLAGRTICGRCGANLVTFADKCIADLDQRCPGFDAIDAAKLEADKQVGLS